MNKPCNALPRICFILLLCCCGLCAAFPVYAQQPLNQHVTIRVVRQPVDTVLARLSLQSKGSFSFIGSPFRKDSLVTLQAVNKPLRQVLDQLFQGRMQYIESGDNIILQRADAQREKNYVISGTVRDRLSGLAIKDASIYEHANLTSTFTDNEGHFHLRLKDRGRLPSVQLTISKEFYLDTALYVMPGFDREISVAIAPAVPVQLREFTVTDGVDKTWLGRRLLSASLRRQTQNISRFLADKPIQTSILPAVGTHGKMSGQVVNHFSLNIIGGYTAGTDGVEVAGGFNINKQDAQYAQVAGLFNLVGGHLTGAQAAGGLNRIMKSASGAQAAGLANIVDSALTGAQAAGGINKAGDSSTGMQAAGLANLARGSFVGAQFAGGLNTARGNMTGIQAGGISNFVAGELDAAQFTGGINHAAGDMKGIQVAGLANISGPVANGVQITGGLNLVRGEAATFQLAGLANYSRGAMNGGQLAGGGNHAGGAVKGIQLAPLYNAAGGLQGMQVAALLNRTTGLNQGIQAGIINYSRRLKGVQIGLVNIADSSAGTSIGLINIVGKKGYYRLAAGTSDLLTAQVGVKTGRRQFYSVITAGIGDDVTGLGFGLGREFTLHKKLCLNAEVHQLTLLNSGWNVKASVIRMQPVVSYYLTPWLAIFGGPAVSYGEYKHDSPEPAKGYPQFYGNDNTKVWLGWHAGITFF